MGAVVNAKVGDLEEDVREGLTRRLRKELTSVLQGVSGKKRFLVRFQYGCKKDMTSNNFTIVILYSISTEEEPQVTMIPEIPDKKDPFEKVYYNGIHVVLHFYKGYGVDWN